MGAENLALAFGAELQIARSEGKQRFGVLGPHRWYSHIQPQPIPVDHVEQTKVRANQCTLDWFITRVPTHSRILVTGGTGFLGAHIVDLLLERGVAVVVTARSESKAKGLIQRRSRFKDLLKVIITGDLSTVGAFDDPAKDVDVIIHCASVSCQLFILIRSGLSLNI